ncbi:MAG TPA: 2-oxoglutarate dehydrogenase E1 component [Candidatus Binatia bacterium]|jgi:2-oxoglutarate dehydrogenase E1 component
MNFVTNAANLTYVEGLYAEYLKDPAALPNDWQRYFSQMDGDGNVSGRMPSLKPHAVLASAQPPVLQTNRRTGMVTTIMDQLRRMIEAFRTKGHWMAHVDPLHLRENRVDELNPEYYGFTSDDWDLLFPAEDLQFSTPVSLREIVARLRNTYCGSVGAEFMHIRENAVKTWLQQRMESTDNRLGFSKEQQQRILFRLIDAVTFEEFIRKKFLGAKSFSIEGAETLIPLLDSLIERAAEQGLEEIVFAMAHRGRLNVLANIIGKKPREIFHEFADADIRSWDGSGDVKYHLGHSSDYETHAGRRIHLSLCFNPSHIEFVDPVAVGRTRAKQDRVSDRKRLRGMALLIHGDAGFAGEGIVQETLNLSQLDAYTVGGTVHVIVNNQIGFTTPPEEGRASRYATDIAKMLDIPIFHVNGDDPESCVWVTQLAMEFRKTFHRDVVIDMYCYRRWGHNEADEPSFTQPVLYHTIKKQKTVRDLYLQQLVEQGCVAREEAEKRGDRYRGMLEEELKMGRGSNNLDGAAPFRGIWQGFRGGPEREADTPATGVELERLEALLEAQIRLPKDFHAHPKIMRAIDARRQMASGRQPLDWSAAEALAFASVATEGIRVRLSGEDSGRGTFSHRHGILYDYQNGRPYVPLQHLSPDQAPVEIFNSPLSEAGVLGFEYGYSLDCPDGLVLWEAQFGDFSNAAQVIIDQFITTAEEKWRRLSGLVMLLPHGFEGMGPEHSSARLERFLQLAVKDNIQVVYPTTPAQYFHCLRRQALRTWRKPLIILTPKSLLRHPQVLSTLAEFSNGRFEPVIGDFSTDPTRAQRVLLCSGKIFYELDKTRREWAREDIAIIRMEQLYPLPEKALNSAMEAFPRDTPVFWVQEEPINMGAWSYLSLKFRGTLFGHVFSVVCRPAAASPATGWGSVHKKEQAKLLKEALGTTTIAGKQTSDEKQEALLGG